MRGFLAALMLYALSGAPVSWIVWQNYSCCSLRSPTVQEGVQGHDRSVPQRDALDELALAHPPVVVPVYSEPLLPIEVPPLTVLPRPRPAATVLLLAEARAALGKGPRELGVRSDLWCADWINKVLRQIGLKGTGSALAVSFKPWGRAASKPCTGCVGLMPRRGGSGHVVVVDKVRGGKVYAYSPNGGRNRMRYATYPVKRFITFRAPSA